MNFKKLILIISILFLSACNQFDQNNKNLVYISDQKYSNTGFALIYDDELKKEKKISQIFGKKYGLMVNSGSSANLLALSSFKF